MVTTMDCISPQAQQRVLPSLPLYQRCDVYALIAKFLEDEGADEVAAQVLAAAKELGVQPTNLTGLINQAQITAHMSHMLTQLLNQQLRDASLQMQPGRQQAEGMPDLEMLALPSTTLPNHMHGGNSYPAAQEHPQGAVTFPNLPAGATPYQPMSPLPELPAPSPELGNHESSRLPELPPELPAESRPQQILHPLQQNQQNHSPMHRTVDSSSRPQQPGMHAQYTQMAQHAQHNSIGGAGRESMQVQYSQMAQHAFNGMSGVNNEPVQAPYQQLAQHSSIGGSGNEPQAQASHSSAQRRHSSTFLMQQEYRIPDAPSVSSGGNALPARQGIPITIAKSVHILPNQMQNSAPTSSPNTSISFAMNVNRPPRPSDPQQQMQPQLHVDPNNHFNSMGGASRSISFHHNLQQHTHHTEHPQNQETVTQRCDSHSRVPIQDISLGHHTPMQHYNVMPRHHEPQHSYPHMSPAIHQQPTEQHQTFQPMQFQQQSQQEQHQGGDTYHRIPSEHELHMMQSVHHQQQHQQHSQQLQQHMHDYQPNGSNNYQNQHGHLMQHQQLPIQMHEAEEQALEQAQKDLNVPLLTDTPINIEPDELPMPHRQQPPDETGNILDLIRGDEDDDDECDIQEHLEAPMATAPMPVQDLGSAREEDPALHLQPLHTRLAIPSEEGELDPRLHQVTPSSPADLMAQGVLTPALDYSDSPLDEHVDDIGSGRGRSSWDAENGQHAQQALNDPAEQLSTALGDVGSARHDRLMDNGSYPIAGSKDTSPMVAQSKHAPVCWPPPDSKRQGEAQKEVKSGERAGQKNNAAKATSRPVSNKDLQEAREEGKTKTKRGNRDQESQHQTAQDRLSQPRAISVDEQQRLNDGQHPDGGSPDLHIRGLKSGKKEKRKHKHRDGSGHKHEHKHKRRSKGRSVTPQLPQSHDEKQSNEPSSAGRNRKRGSSHRLTSPSSPPRFSPDGVDDPARATPQRDVSNHCNRSPLARGRSSSPSQTGHQRLGSNRTDKHSKLANSSHLHRQQHFRSPSSPRHPSSHNHRRHSQSHSPENNRHYSHSPPRQVNRRHAKPPSPIRKHASHSHSSAPKLNPRPEDQSRKKRYSPSPSTSDRYQSRSPSPRRAERPVRNERPQSPPPSQQQINCVQSEHRTAERQSSVGVGRDRQHVSHTRNANLKPQETSLRDRRQEQGAHKSLCDRMNDRNMLIGQQFKFVDHRSRHYRKQEDVDDTNSGSPYVDSAFRYNKNVESMYNDKTQKGISNAKRDRQEAAEQKDRGHASNRQLSRVVERRDSQSSGQVGYVHRKSSNTISQTGDWEGKRESSFAPKQLTNQTDRLVKDAKLVGKQYHQSCDDDRYDDQATQLQPRGSAHNQGGNKRSWQASGRQYSEADADDYRNGKGSKRTRT